jgi:hypothetical protein
MEDVLAVYGRPYDEQYPVVGMDEKPYRLLEDVREPLRVKPGHTEKVDNEYRRKGTSSIFMCTEPLGGWRQVEALPQRRKKDRAHTIQWLVDTQYPEAKKEVLVMDNLNTHTISWLYETIPPEEAFRLARKLELHFTPKHGSWLWTLPKWNYRHCRLSVAEGGVD